MNTFDIGTIVWMATYARHEHHVTCPDCSGTKSIGILLPSGEKYDIPCQGCGRGFDPPTGRITEYVFETQARSYTVTGVRISAHHPVEYELNGTSSCCTIGYEDRTFGTEAEAQEQGEALRQAAEDEANKRRHSKLKDHRSWAWHVTYYRGELKRALRDVERFEKALGIATEKAK